MSHIATVDLQIFNLEALKIAAASVGLEFLENQKNFRAYRAVNPCVHALRVIGMPNAYEIGLATRGDGSYALLWDNYANGQGLCDKIGEDAGLLLQAYGIQAAIADAELEGMTYQQETDAEGNIFLVCVEAN